MTEAIWLRATIAGPLLKFLREAASVRKLRLFACACCREWQPLQASRTAFSALELMEQYADGLITRPEPTLNKREVTESLVGLIGSGNAHSAACRIEAELAHRDNGWILRDIFGNPFRPVIFDPSWRTDTALALARQMYESREFSAMPILADAVQDAGCDNEDVLTHCRDARAGVLGGRSGAIR